MYDFPDDPVVNDLNVLLVGGAVRDLLLNRQIKERDWVVVGATPQQLLARGFQSVGKDFPVFLHPQTHEEYALARTERKTAAGHQGFEFHTAPDVTLEQDLSRRDFTINAMAIDRQGQLHDPFGGQDALVKRQMVPVGKAFAEDPLRVFRGARFIAQLEGFQASPALIQQIPRMRGEFSALSVERLWAETLKAFHGRPERYFECLNEWQIHLDLGLPEFFVQPTHGENSPEHTLADWNSVAPAPLSWPEQWRAPKDWVQLIQDARSWTHNPTQRAEQVLTAGAIKNTPRWQRLLSWITRHQDTALLQRAVNQARAIQAHQFSQQYSGPALGRALKGAWLTALSDGV